MKKRLIGIDVIRILCAILILFFMISGFCLSFSKRNLSGKNEILDFYKRRILKLLPLYWVIEIYLLIISIYYGSEWINRIKILPIRLLGLHWWDCSIILFDADERMVSWNGFILQYIF